jgi:LPS O-antigen subunit length determinant protein (WzzB/FepE family)
MNTNALETFTRNVTELVQWVSIMIAVIFVSILIMAIAIKFTFVMRPTWKSGISVPPTLDRLVGYPSIEERNQ